MYIAARCLAAFIMLQTLYFKFSGAQESIYIFSALGIEPWGRYATGIAELVASLLLLWLRTAWMGGILAIGIMTGALFSHLFVLGLEVQNDGGQLFIYALLVWLCGIGVVLFNRQQIQGYLKKIVTS